MQALSALLLGLLLACGAALAQDKQEQAEKKHLSLTAEPTPKNPPWESGAQIGYLSGETGHSWSTKAALNYEFDDVGTSFGASPSLSAKVNRNTQTGKETNMYGGEAALDTAQYFDACNCGLNPGIRVGLNRDNSKNAAQRKFLSKASTEIVASSIGFGSLIYAGPIGFAFLPVAGVYYWNSSDAPKSSIATGGETGVLGSVDFVARGSRSKLRQPAPEFLERLDFKASLQKWVDVQAYGGMTKTNYRNATLTLGYKLYNPDDEKKPGIFKPSLALRRVSGENPEQGQAKQSYTQVTLEILY